MKFRPVLVRHAFLRLLGTIVLLAPLALSAAEPANPKTPPAKGSATYKEDEVLKEAQKFFGAGAKGIADVIAKAFKEQGQPNGFIKGEEAGGAVAVGLRYGKGTLQMKSGATLPVYWKGPSIGFDFGGNAAKTFVLVYNLPSTDKLFQRYPGVDGSLYFVGGVGLHYVRRDDITLAPVQFGVGWRQGAAVGYMHFTKKKSYNPF